MSIIFNKRRQKHDALEEDVLNIVRPYTDRRHLPDRRVSFSGIPCSYDFKTNVHVENNSYKEYMRLWSEGELVFIIYQNGDGEEYGDGELYADWIQYLNWIGPIPASINSTSGDNYYRIGTGRKLKLKDFLKKANDEVELFRSTEQRFINYCFLNNKFILKIERETQLPKWIYNKLHYIHNDNIELIDHFPSLITWKTLIQVRADSSKASYPYIKMEKEFYLIAKQLSNLNIPILMIWQHKHYKFYGQWANKLTTIPDINQKDTKNAHTPYVLINKKLLKPIDEFMDEI